MSLGGKVFTANRLFLTASRWLRGAETGAHRLWRVGRGLASGIRRMSV